MTDRIDPARLARFMVRGEDVELTPANQDRRRWPELFSGETAAMTDRARDKDGNPIPLHRMTPDEQIRQQSGPGTEGLPGFVVTDPGPNAWYFDDDAGEWRQEDDEGEGR